METLFTVFWPFQNLSDSWPKSRRSPLLTAHKKHSSTTVLKNSERRCVIKRSHFCVTESDVKKFNQSLKGKEIIKVQRKVVRIFSNLPVNDTNTTRELERHRETHQDMQGIGQTHLEGHQEVIIGLERSARIFENQKAVTAARSFDFWHLAKHVRSFLLLPTVFMKTSGRSR